MIIQHSGWSQLPLKWLNADRARCHGAQQFVTAVAQTFDMDYSGPNADGAGLRHENEQDQREWPVHGHLLAVHHTCVARYGPDGYAITTEKS